jgi:hypothetical protein
MPVLVTVQNDKPLPRGPVIYRKQGHLAPLYDAPSLRAFYLEPANRRAVLDVLDEMHARHPVRMISLDVFDTALLREPKSEAERFMEISLAFVERARNRNKLPAFGADDAFMARVMAAQSAYAMAPLRCGNREGVLEDVARATCELLGCSKLAALYMENELDYEIAATQVNPLVEEITAHFSGMKVVFVSDMYLSSRQIQTLLRRSPAARQSTVFSSADGRGSKRSGQLFSHVEAATGGKGRDVVHIGDSLVSDYQMPIRHGWRALHLPLPERELASRRASHQNTIDRFIAAGIPMSKYLHFNA